MLQNPNFPGSAPNLAGEAYSTPTDSLADGEGFAAPLPRTPPSSRPFGPRFYRSHRWGLTHYRVGNATNDKFQM